MYPVFCIIKIIYYESFNSDYMLQQPKIGIILFMLTVPGFNGCNQDKQTLQEQPISSEVNTGFAADSTILIPVGSFSSDYFPCSMCHDELPLNTQRRKLVDMHDDIVFDHDSANRWCLACHSATTRDSLVLAGGQLLGFPESYRLCGQCHGPKYRDWRLGIHGKRTGNWNGQKQYFLCVQCHDPHSPKIKPLQPMPPPRRPEVIKIDSTYEDSTKTTASS